MTHDELKSRLRKIEALYAGAKTDGERSAAEAAAERIRARLNEVRAVEPPVEMRFSIMDPWSRRLFIALCRRYGLKPYRFRGMKRQSLILKVPTRFVNETLWPEFSEINEALTQYLSSITEKIIREEVHEQTEDAKEVPEGAQLEG